MARTVVAGASGFLGSRLVAELGRRGHHVRAVTRGGAQVDGANETVAAGNLLSADLPRLVEGMDVIINCAARVHVRDESDAPAFYRMNCQFAADFAEAAKAAGARRFVQLSSVAAITSQTRVGEVADDATRPGPGTAYGKSKLAGDKVIAGLSGPTFRVVALRPPVIIGRGAGAWFRMLDRAARLGMPLPIGRITNSRSFALVENIVDAVIVAAAGEAEGSFVVTDSEPISTAALYRRMLALHGYSDRVWNWPASAMRLAASAILRERASSLLGNAAYDGRRFREVFRWNPPVSFEQGLQNISGSGPQRGAPT